MVVPDGTFDVLSYYHSFRLSTEFYGAEYFRIKVTKHNLGFGGDSVWFTLHHLAKKFLRSSLVIFRIVLVSLGYFVEAVVCGIVGENIMDKALFEWLVSSNRGGTGEKSRLHIRCRNVQASPALV